MKTIPFDENARDVEHDASVEVPDDTRDVLISVTGDEWDGMSHYDPLDNWGMPIVRWRELPAPPKPTPKIVPHSLQHWHDPKVERPEDGRPVALCMKLGGYVWQTMVPDDYWEEVLSWSYCQERGR